MSATHKDKKPKKDDKPHDKKTPIDVPVQEEPDTPMPTLGSILSTSNLPTAVAVAATPGATVAVDIDAGDVFHWTAGENETVNVTGTHAIWRKITFIILNDGTLPRVITFGTGIRSLGVVTGVASKISTIEFISNGTDMIEVARAVAIT